MTDEEIQKLERPDPALWKLYLLRCLAILPILPIFPFALLVHWFRYHTLRYRFDDEGIHCSWGVLIRHEVNVAYSRMQDIHLTSGILQRWLGLADVQVQTASGNAGAELTVEGFKNSAEIRDFLYRRMRGARPATALAASPNPVTANAEPTGAAELPAGLIEVLAQVRDELRATRVALEKRTPPAP